MRVIRSGDCPEHPWKNGRGTTREIAVFPEDACMDDFLWRLSMARVDEPGMFSLFPGIDRVMAVLDGDLHLASPTRDVWLHIESSPLSFDGGERLIGAPLSQPVLDLNAMGRRGRFRPTMTRLGPGDVAHGTDSSFYFALEDQLLNSTRLDRLDCALIDDSIAVQGRGLLITFVALTRGACQHN